MPQWTSLVWRMTMSFPSWASVPSAARAGAAMVIAGLAARGRTEVDHIYHIERGYEDIVGKLSNLGANIHLEVEPDEDAQKTPQVG